MSGSMWQLKITCEDVRVGIPAVHHLLMWQTQVSLSLHALSVCVTVVFGHFININTSVCACRQACRDNLTYSVDGGWVCCGGHVVCVRIHDPRAGGQRWIEVTGAAVRS